MYVCLGAGSNCRPFPLQGNALPTELPKQPVDYTGFSAFFKRVNTVSRHYALMDYNANTMKITATFATWSSFCSSLSILNPH